jgi:hypothetical protein
VYFMVERLLRERRTPDECLYFYHWLTGHTRTLLTGRGGLPSRYGNCAVGTGGPQGAVSMCRQFAAFMRNPSDRIWIAVLENIKVHGKPARSVFRAVNGVMVSPTFADDQTLVYYADWVDGANQSVINALLHELYEWARAEDMEYGLAKCKFMVVGGSAAQRKAVVDTMQPFMGDTLLTELPDEAVMLGMRVQRHQDTRRVDFGVRSNAKILALVAETRRGSWAYQQQPPTLALNYALARLRGAGLFACESGPVDEKVLDKAQKGMAAAVTGVTRRFNRDKLLELIGWLPADKMVAVQRAKGAVRLGASPHDMVRAPLQEMMQLYSERNITLPQRRRTENALRSVGVGDVNAVWSQATPAQQAVADDVVARAQWMSDVAKQKQLAHISKAQRGFGGALMLGDRNFLSTYETGPCPMCGKHSAEGWQLFAKCRNATVRGIASESVAAVRAACPDMSKKEAAAYFMDPWAASNGAVTARMQGKPIVLCGETFRGKLDKAEVAAAFKAVGYGLDRMKKFVQSVRKQYPTKFGIRPPAGRDFIVGGAVKEGNLPVSVIRQLFGKLTKEQAEDAQITADKDSATITIVRHSKPETRSFTYGERSWPSRKRRSSRRTGRSCRARTGRRRGARTRSGGSGPRRATWNWPCRHSRRWRTTSRGRRCSWPASCWRSCAPPRCRCTRGAALPRLPASPSRLACGRGADEHGPRSTCTRRWRAWPCRRLGPACCCCRRAGTRTARAAWSGARRRRAATCCSRPRWCAAGQTAAPGATRACVASVRSGTRRATSPRRRCACWPWASTGARTTTWSGWA